MSASTAAKSAGAAKATGAPASHVVRMRNGPGDATAGDVARMVTWPEVSRIPTNLTSYCVAPAFELFQ